MLTDARLNVKADQDCMTEMWNQCPTMLTAVPLNQQTKRTDMEEI